MATATIHQAIHGYRDGHRLLSSSTPLSAEATRTMLVLSDMSGPSMQPGFDEYLTGYPLTGADFFVVAKTWYAPEMQRPGCVWTHSLLIPRSHVGRVPTTKLRAAFRRPQAEGVESAAAAAVELPETVASDTSEGFADRALAASMIGAVLGQPRPVIVVAETATQYEALFLRLWEELWPAERARFSFCTGALMPRSNAGSLLDLQAVPRAIPPSQFRKSASTALILDAVRARGEAEPWVDLVLDDAANGEARFRTWLESAAGGDAGRAAVPSLAPIFGAWHAPGASARTALAAVLGAEELDARARDRLVGMAFDRASSESGAAGRRELLLAICAYREIELASLASTLEVQIRRLFDDSRADGVALVQALLGGALTEAGEHVLRDAVQVLVPNDLESFGGVQASYLPTLAGTKPQLASSPVLWKQVGNRGGEVLAQLGSTDLDEEKRAAIVDAVLCSGADVSVDALVRFGGKTAIFRGLAAIATGQLPLSWPWRSALGVHRDTVLEWLERIPSPSPGELELGTRFLSPRYTQARLAAVWKAGLASADSVVSRVASFGLTLAFAEGDVESPLFALCLQTTYDAAAGSRMDYDEWEWLQDQAPPVSWYRTWDRCERLAAVVARLVEKQRAPLETLFAIVHSRDAIRKVADILDNNRETRPYLKSLRKAAEGSDVGTREQRIALLDS